ncbi:MAG TPA: M23 family metallopeptidase [Polyangiales bacterium]|nr:M23 family metallopeptidase [Polyangiales bacterium]
MRYLQRCAFITCLCLGAEAHADRGAGISADLAVDQALRALENQTAHNDELASDLSSLQVRELELHTALRAHVRALYRVTRTGTAPVAGGFVAMRSYLSRVRRLKSMVASDIAAVTAVHKEQNVAREQVRQGQRDLMAAQSQLSKLRDVAITATPRAQEGNDQQPDRGFYGMRLSGGGKSVIGFEELRGKLTAPVNGELRLRDVHRDNASALLFEAPAGTSVRASAAGRVAWSDAHTVVVDHGDGYQTAYGQLGNVEVRSGDEVSALARLGSVADASEPALLFEIRKGSRSVPARAWLGL